MESEGRQAAASSPHDTHAIKEVISKVKSQGLFDQFRKECLTDVDTKPAYNNLIQRVEKFVERFLNGQKWNANVNKNQLRETLRRQLNNSGVMSIGVDRIIEQVVNPKILLGIKPKIDEAVCDYLGIDQKARQEEQQKRKHEQQRLLLQQQQLQQQHIQSLINQNMKSEDAFNNGASILHTPGNLPWSQTMPGSNFPGSAVSGMANSIAGASGGTNSVPGPFNPQAMGFGGMMQSFYMGGWAPGLPGMEGFNQTMQSMIPGQPMIPAFGGSGIAPTVSAMSSFNNAASPSAGSVNSSFNTSSVASQSTSAPSIPDLSKPPPGLPGTPLLSSTSNIGSSPGVSGLPHQSSPMVPPGIMPSPVSAIIRPPLPGSIPPPPGTVPVISQVTLVPPPSLRAVPTTPTIPALISHTLSKVSKEDLTPEKIAVFKTAAAFITKTVNNAQGTPGADLATMFSPRVLAEAMMAESGKPLTKQQIRTERRKERQKEFERLKAEREKEEEAERKRVSEMKFASKEDPLPPKHNLMDVFQAAEDVSEDEEAFDMLIDAEELENKHRQGIVLSDDSKEEEQPPTSQPGKKYNFAWDVDKDPGELSDVTVSSIHTSDISSFEELSSSDTEDETETVEEDVQEEEVDSAKAEQLTESEDLDEQNASKSDENQILEHGSPSERENVIDTTSSVAIETSSVAFEAELPKPTDVIESQFAADVVPLIPPVAPAVIHKVNKSETSKPKSETIKPRKLIALSYKYSDSEDDESREERKARIAKEKEDRYLKRQQRRAEMECKRKEREDERTRLREEKKNQKEQQQPEPPEEDKTELDAEIAVVEDLNASIITAEPDTPSKSPSKKRKNKAEMKEQLHQKKVLERKAALRRKRTRNHRYTSEEFTSIFTERKALNQSYSEPAVDSEEILTFDGSLEVVEMTVDQECVIETVGEELEAGDVAGRDDLVLQCRSPYSDISDRSMSDRSEEEHKMTVEMEEVSSDEDLEITEKPTDDEDVKTSSSVHESDDNRSQNKDGIILVSRMTTRSKSAAILGGGNSVTENDDKGKSPQYADSLDQGMQYNTDDLYKHHSSLRSTSTPLSSSDAKSSRAAPSSLSDNDDRTSQLSSGAVSSLPSQPDGVDKFTKEVVDESAAEEGEMASPRQTVDIMGELELESVSDEDSPLDNLNTDDSSDDDKEEGEERDSEKEEKVPQILKVEVAPVKMSDVTSKDDEASDEGEIKSDSEESVKALEEEKERMAHRKPIELVDFGEAEKRARGTRSFYPETQQERGRSARGMTVSSHPPPPPPPPPPSYRGGYTSWPQPETSMHSQYSTSGIRYSVSHEGSSSSNVKSPIGASYDGGESEASSHSRSSVRLRDDVPPPYPIEGVTRKHRSPASDQGSSTLYKNLSPPSPVSSVSSSHSQTSSSVPSKSGSGSQSKSGSRSSSSSSSLSSSHSSHRRKKRRSKRNKQNQKRSKDTDKAASVMSLTSTSKLLLCPERNFSPAKFSEDISSVPLISQSRERHLSSGHESISSDELPYFPDEQPPSPVQKKRSRSPDENSSSSSTSSMSHQSMKKEKEKRRESISSSELIYSPSRQKSPRRLSETSKDDDEVSIERPPMSPGRSSISSDELPEDPEPELMQQFSPHRPPLPSDLPPLPEDTDGFQPPLPQDSPPMLFDTYPPLPPIEENNEDSAFPPLPPQEVEDGEIEEEIESVSENVTQEKVVELVKKPVVESLNLSMEEHRISPPEFLTSFASELIQVHALHSDAIREPSLTLHCAAETLNLVPLKSQTLSQVNIQSLPSIFPVHHESSVETIDIAELQKENSSLGESEAYGLATFTEPVILQAGDITTSISINLDEINNEIVTNSETKTSEEDNALLTQLSYKNNYLTNLENVNELSQPSVTVNKTSIVAHSCSEMAKEAIEIIVLPSNSEIKMLDKYTVPLSSSDIKIHDSEAVLPQSSSEKIMENAETVVRLPSSEIKIQDSEAILPKPSSEMTVENTDLPVLQPSLDIYIESTETVLFNSSSQKTVENSESAVPLPSSEIKIQVSVSALPQSSSEMTTENTDFAVSQSGLEINIEGTETFSSHSSSEKTVENAKILVPLSSSEIKIQESEIVLPQSTSEKVEDAKHVALQSSSKIKLMDTETTIVLQSCSDITVTGTDRTSPRSLITPKSPNTSETFHNDLLSTRTINTVQLLISSEDTEKVPEVTEPEIPTIDCYKSLPSDGTQHIFELQSHSTTTGTSHIPHTSLEPPSSLEASPHTSELSRLPKEEDLQDIKNPSSPELPNLAVEDFSPQKISPVHKIESTESTKLDPPSLTRLGEKSPIPFLELSPQPQTVTPEDKPNLNLQSERLHTLNCESNKNSSNHEQMCSAQGSSMFIASNVNSCVADSFTSAETSLTSEHKSLPPSSELNFEQTFKNSEITVSHLTIGSIKNNVSSLGICLPSPSTSNSSKEVLPCGENVPALNCEKHITTATLTNQSSTNSECQEFATLSPTSLQPHTSTTSQQESTKSNSFVPKLELPKEPICSPQTLPSPGQRSVSSEDTCETTSTMGLATRKRMLEDSGNSSDASAASSESIPKRRRRGNYIEADADKLILPSSSTTTLRPETRLQQQQQQELSKPQTRARSNSLPFNKDIKRKTEHERSPPTKKQKR